MSRSDASGAFPGDTLLAGASGLIGRAFAAQWRGPGRLHLLVRRPMPAPGPLCRVQVVDFGALPVLPTLPRATAAVCCLGTTIAVAGSPQAFRAVDLDAVIAFARAAQAAGVQHFAVVSALGADPRSPSLYSRTKGEMEAGLAALGFASLIVARPSLLAGDRAALGQPPRRAEAWALALMRPLAPLVPKAWRPIEAATVARALGVALAQAQTQTQTQTQTQGQPRGPAGTRVLSSAALQDLGRASADRP